MIVSDALADAPASDTPCVSSQIGSRHLPLKQGIVSSSLTWRTNLECGGLDAALDRLRNSKSSLTPPSKAPSPSRHVGTLAAHSKNAEVM